MFQGRSSLADTPETDTDLLRAATRLIVRNAASLVGHRLAPIAPTGACVPVGGSLVMRLFVMRRRVSLSGEMA